jgi:hypothetical protein
MEDRKVWISPRVGGLDTFRAQAAIFCTQITDLPAVLHLLKDCQTERLQKARCTKCRNRICRIAQSNEEEDLEDGRGEEGEIEVQNTNGRHVGQTSSVAFSLRGSNNDYRLLFLSNSFHRLLPHPRARCDPIQQVKSQPSTFSFCAALADSFSVSVQPAHFSAVEIVPKTIRPNPRTCPFAAL